MKGQFLSPLPQDVLLKHSGVGAGSRVFWLLDRQSSIPLNMGKAIAPGRNGPIRFEDVRFTYPSRKEVEVLRGVSMTVEPGTSVALV